MAIGNLLFGSPAQTTRLPLFDQGQMGIKNQLANLGLQGIGNYNPQKFDFAPIAQQARSDFASKTAPLIAERFNAQNNRPSGPVYSALAGAGSELDQGLAALQQQYNMQQQGYDLQRQGQLSGLLGMGLTPNYENIYQPATTGLLGGLAPGFGQGLGNLAGLYAMNRLGGGGTDTNSTTGNSQSNTGGLLGRLGAGLGSIGAGSAFGPVGLGIGGGLALLSLLSYLKGS